MKKFEGVSRSYTPKTYNGWCPNIIRDKDKLQQSTEGQRTYIANGRRLTSRIIFIISSIFPYAWKEESWDNYIYISTIKPLLYYFITLGCSICGFRNSIRLVIAVDETFLKGLYKGTMFVTACKDGNNQIYLLTFGISDSENNELWEWLIIKLEAAISEIDNFIFLLNHHGSIHSSITKVFPKPSHGACKYHLGQNLKSNFRKVEESVYNKFLQAIEMYSISKYDDMMNQIRTTNPRVAQYFFRAGYEKWAPSHFNGKKV